MDISKTMLFLLTFIATFAVTAMVERRLIPLLRTSARQPIYDGGPSWHISKSGTPTMGGLAFIISFLPTVIAICFYLFRTGDARAAYTVILAAMFAVSNASVGIIDDLTKLRRHENAGLSPLQKLILQTVFSAIFLFLRYKILGDTTTVALGTFTVELGAFYYFFAMIALLGIVNCANLTDGVDGLAASVAFAIGAVFFFLFAEARTDIGCLSASLIGISVAFMIFNVHPARIFMGDTGSLFLGAIVASIGFSAENHILLLFVSAVYVIEGVSVIIQVICYKLTGKRIFKMAPLHHHLEKCGMSEEKISVIAIVATFLFALLGTLLLL